MNITKILIQSQYPFQEISPEELEQLKKVYLDIFKDIYTACKKHDINVMLSGGACLGAIRHNGFIPWDDDMDIMLMRNEYEKLPQILLSEFPDKYICTGPNISDHTNISFMRIEKKGTLLKSVYDNPQEHNNIFIDVFPIDNIPDSIIVRVFNSVIADTIHYIALCMKYYDHRECPMTTILLSSPIGKKEIKVRLFIGKLFSFLTNYTYLFNILDNFIARHRNKITKYVGVPSSRRYLREIYPSDTILPVSYHKFEDIDAAPIPNNSDVYLKTLYGDYMQLPPVEKRERHFIVEMKLPEG